MDTLKNARGL